MRSLTASLTAGDALDGAGDGCEESAMTKSYLKVTGIPSETKKALAQSAQARYGQANASLLARALIAQHLGKSAVETTKPLTESEATDTVRVELRLPRTVLEKITIQAENNLTPRNHYLAGVILAYFGQPQLRGDEIETLRRSNYELSKIGNNLNQIAKAFNTIVKSGGDKIPEIGKKMASLRREIGEHTKHVLRVLHAGSAFWEVKQGRGQKPRKMK
jgi:hypothetical protein